MILGFYTIALPLGAGLLFGAVDGASIELQDRQAADSVHEAFVNSGKSFFGTATDQGLLQTSPNAAIIQENFGQVTHENSMKWGSLEATRGQYNWGPADDVVDWATDNGKIIRGHTLVWHSQLPSWVEAISDAEELREAIRTHVSETVGRYAGRIAQWVCTHRMTTS